MTDNLPARPEMRKMGAQQEASVKAGQWWRYAGPPESRPDFRLKPGALPPLEPLTLLVLEVRIHDGDIHSVHLARHPSWEEGGWRRMEPIKLLTADFFRDYVPEADSVALARREEEIARLMGAISEKAAMISSGPDRSTLLDLTDQIRREDERKAYDSWRQKEVSRIADTVRDHRERQAKIEALPDRIPASEPVSGMLPAALLPSGDALAVQARIEEEVLVMRASGKWISAASEEMTASMSVVAAFQTEKVTAVSSGVADKMSQAERMLKNVRTMKLFLGEGMEVEVLSTGNSAPSAEPLHLMQRMLYLDEELYIADRFEEGFTGDDFADLPELLSANPDLVKRMLPHQRCVAITKARRHARPFQWSGDGSLGDAVRGVFERLRQEEADSAIQILIRDGENVRMVIADQETSAATRLFPSKAEIDGIYRGSGGHEITPHDIEYSDHRNAHDSRALFYKRFLIILWGLHEREDAFGDFMAKGMNWLHESIANDCFVFIHDEENVLGSGRKPVGTFISDANSRIRPGSTVLIRTRSAVTPDTAPTIFKDGNHSNNFRSDQIRRPVNPYEVVQVTRRGNEIVATIPTGKRWEYNEGKAPQNTPVILVSSSGQHAEGILCLDDVMADDLRIYAQSRIARETYLDWLDMFHRAIPVLEERDLRDKPALDAMANHGMSGAYARQILSMRRLSRRDKSAPMKHEDGLAAIRTAGEIARKSKRANPEDILMANHAGDVDMISAHAGHAGVALPLLSRTNLVTGETSSMEPRYFPDKGELLLQNRESFHALIKASVARAQPGFLTEECVDRMMAIDPGPALKIMCETEAIDDAAAKVILDGFYSEPAKDGSVMLPYRDHVLGVAILKREELVEKRYSSQFDNPRTRLFMVRECLLTSLLKSGHQKMMMPYFNARLRDPVGFMSRLGERFHVLTSEKPVSARIKACGATVYRHRGFTAAKPRNDLNDLSSLFLTHISTRPDDIAAYSDRIRFFAGGQEDRVLPLLASHIRIPSGDPTVNSSMDL